MIVLLLNLAAFAAMFCFALSIPFGATPTGRMLRFRGLGILVAMAILAVVLQFIGACLGAIGHWALRHPFSTIISIIVVSAIAYFVRHLRHRSGQPPAQQRLAVKQPFIPRRHDDDLFGFLREQMERDQERDDG